MSKLTNLRLALDLKMVDWTVQFGLNSAKKVIKDFKWTWKMQKAGTITQDLFSGIWVDQIGISEASHRYKAAKENSGM